MIRQENSVGDELLLQMFCRDHNHYRYEGAADFRDKHPDVVAAACAVLEFLSYVTLDDSSVFGLRPTPSLISQLLRASDSDRYPGTGKPTRNDREIIRKLIEVSGRPEFWGLDSAHGRGKLSSLLVKLRLAHWKQDEDEVIPTDVLYQEYLHATVFDPDEL
jgi:hypothetical protein